MPLGWDVSSSLPRARPRTYQRYRRNSISAEDHTLFSGTPTLPFSREEHIARQARLRATQTEHGFDVILVFAQESHYWLTGYDRGGSVFFQCAVITA